MIQSLQPKCREFEPTCVLLFLFFAFIRFVWFHLLWMYHDLWGHDTILDHSISKGWCITRKMSQSVRIIFRDSRENIVPYYSQNIRLKVIHYTCCLNLGSVGKRLKKSMQQVLALRQSRYVLISAITLKICQKHRDSISHIERTVNVLCGDPTKITNASIDRQITLKRDYIYKIWKLLSRNRGFRRFIT